ncbi:MAG: hypothetical protein Roseis2KO_50260 [Roseivirga sp.]
MVMLFSCEQSQDEAPTEQPELPAELAVLFQYEYINWAWGYQHRGWFIDNHGNRRKFDVSESGGWKNTDNDGYISKEDLTSSLAKATEVSQQIPLSVIVQHEQLIPGTVDGDLSEPENGGADMGAFAYFCYAWDEERQLYKKQLLSVEGDWSQHNTSQEAVALTKWLRTFRED